MLSGVSNIGEVFSKNLKQMNPTVTITVVVAVAAIGLAVLAVASGRREGQRADNLDMRAWQLGEQARGDRMKLRVIQDRCDVKEEELKKAKQTIDRLSTELERSNGQHQGEAARLQRELRESGQKLEQSERSCRDLAAQKTTLIREKHALEQKLEAQSKLARTAQTEARLAQQQRSRADMLEKNLAAREKQLKEKASAVESAQCEIGALNVQMSDQEKRLEQAQVKIAELEAQGTQTSEDQAKIARLTQQLEQQSATAEEAQERVQELQITLLDLNSQKASLEEQLEGLGGPTAAEVDSEQATRIEQLEDQLGQVERQSKAALTELFRKHQAELDAQAAQVDALVQERLAEVLSSHQASRGPRPDADSTVNAALKAELEETQEALRALKDTHKELSAESKRQAEKLEEQELLIEYLQKTAESYGALVETNMRLQMERAKLQEAYDELDGDYRQEQQTVEKEFSKKLAMIARLQSQIDALKGQLAN